MILINHSFSHDFLFLWRRVSFPSAFWQDPRSSLLPFPTTSDLLIPPCVSVCVVGFFVWQLVEEWHDEPRESAALCIWFWAWGFLSFLLGYPLIINELPMTHLFSLHTFSQSCSFNSLNLESHVGSCKSFCRSMLSEPCRTWSVKVG